VGICLDRRSLSFSGELLRCRALGRVSAIARASILKLGTRIGCCRVTNSSPEENLRGRGIFEDMIPKSSFIFFISRVFKKVQKIHLKNFPSISEKLYDQVAKIRLSENSRFKSWFRNNVQINDT
jgi:hypothetical protein